MRLRSDIRLVAAALAGVALGMALAAAGRSLAADVGPAASGSPGDFLGPLSLAEERLLADAAAGRFQETALFEAALRASGEHDATALTHYRQQWSALVKELRVCGSVHGTPRQRAQAVLAFLHRRLLQGGYDLACTDLRQALDHGRFNCVSASLLFHALAAEFALPVCEVAIPGHVKSRVRMLEGSFDVETTCPRWFDMSPAAQKEAEIAARAQLGPAANNARPCEVSTAQLVAMIYYNRAIDLLGDHRFAAAAAANAVALRLDPQSATIRGNLLATVNNWAIDLAAAALPRGRRFAAPRPVARSGLRNLHGELRACLSAVDPRRNRGRPAGRGRSPHAAGAPVALVLRQRAGVRRRREWVVSSCCHTQNSRAFDNPRDLT